MDVLGQVFDGRYRIEERLGSGAMGIVFRARHVKLAARSFAIKILHPSLLSNKKLRRRFEREAETAATLHHPNVVGVVDVGETPDGMMYIVMEYADGAPLSSLLGETAMAAPRALGFMRQLCDGLHHAHAAGLIHRDFKPDNIIVERDRAGIETLRIVDFGIALLRDDALTETRERLTTAGVVLGTPHYMAPEQAIGEAIDHRIDLFALGVICFEMLTGKMPFDGDGVDVARANISCDTPAMGVRVPHLEVDPLLEVFTRKLMTRDRDLRIQTARAARELLDLIDRDRTAAAIALGLATPPQAMPEPRPVVSCTTSGAIPVVPHSTPIPVPSRTSVERAIDATRPTEDVRATRGPARTLAIVSGFVAIALVGLLIAGTRAPRVESVAAVEPPPEHPMMPMPAKPRVDRETVPIEAPPPPPSTQSTTRFPPRGPARPVVEVAAPVEPSANELAQRYSRVGRALDRLQQSRGRDATIELWPRFRYIRIQEAITTVERRRTTAKLLADLERDVNRELD